MSVRKAHNSGRNHLRNVVDYYQQIGQEKAQSVIDSITSSYAAEGQQAPNMMAPGAFPPPFGFPGQLGMPPPPFGIPPPGAPGAPGMLPRMSYPLPIPTYVSRKRKRSPTYPGPTKANQYPYPTAPGAHGLPFPPFPNATGTPPTGGFPPPLPNMPQGANLPIPPPGGFPNFPIPPPGAAGFPPMPGQPGMGPGGPQIPTGPRGLEGYPPPPGGGPPGGMDQRW
ncbi:Zinc finger, U1-C type [Penicillium camemberti]|uniref:Zinc finger, U1-C type n=1 Tax=Penicillium camemberti (strain FM 013) TaxID=1429867 RepID=A0A0G4P490_PENC3|nr:Zinc finger, U1-C type [Penicillium camemberti]